MLPARSSLGLVGLSTDLGPTDLPLHHLSFGLAKTRGLRDRPMQRLPALAAAAAGCLLLLVTTVAQVAPAEGAVGQLQQQVPYSKAAYQAPGPVQAAGPGNAPSGTQRGER